jgi:hypothetical protein
MSEAEAQQAAFYLVFFKYCMVTNIKQNVTFQTLSNCVKTCDGQLD